MPNKSMLATQAQKRFDAFEQKRCNVTVLNKVWRHCFSAYSQPCSKISWIGCSDKHESIIL